MHVCIFFILIPKIIILDKPSAPGEPLEVTDIQRDSVTLAWKPPRDNGGSEIM